MDDRADRQKVLTFFGAASLGTAPIFALTYWMLGGRWTVIALCVSAPLLASAFLVRRITGSVTLAGNWILLVGYFLFLFLAAFTGGLEAPALTWSACIPLVATLMCGLSSGAFWLVMVLIKFAGFYILERTGFPFPAEFSSPMNIDTAYVITVMGLVLFTFFLGAMAEVFRGRHLKAIEQSRAELQNALENVKTLKGMLPICAWCKKIRDDKGYWSQVEAYFGTHTEAEFSHGICPECETKLTKKEEAS